MVQGKASTRQLASVPIAASGSGDTPRNKFIHSTLSFMMQESPPHERLLAGCSSPLHTTRPTPPYGASLCLVQAMPACSAKTRCAPSRHCRDARVYGHTTTAMHDMSTPPPPRSWGGYGEYASLQTRRVKSVPRDYQTGAYAFDGFRYAATVAGAWGADKLGTVGSRQLCIFKVAFFILH